MQLQVKALNFQLAKPFVTHKGITETDVKQVLLEVHHDGFVGHGAAVPSPEYGLSYESVVAELQSIVGDVADMNSPFEIKKLLSNLQSQLSPAALSGLDMALNDLLAKTVGVPLYKLWGLEGLPVPACASSLGLMSLAETVTELKKVKQLPVLKIKMSEPDLERVQLIRQYFNGRLWIDGNGAWETSQAIEFVEALKPYSIELIEQPVAKGDNAPAELKKVQDQTDILIIGDESCASKEDVLKLAGCVSGVNIKLLKAGGLSNAMDMIVMAKQLGLKVMLGCKVESALSIAAMSNLAPLADFLDLDGHVENVNDPFGHLFLGGAPSASSSRGLTAGSTQPFQKESK